jgi:hypothetical protein
MLWSFSTYLVTGDAMHLRIMAAWSRLEDESPTTPPVGLLRVLCACLSVCPSVCPSVRISASTLSDYPGV